MRKGDGLESAISRGRNAAREWTGGGDRKGGAKWKREVGARRLRSVSVPILPLMGPVRKSMRYQEQITGRSLSLLVDSGCSFTHILGAICRPSMSLDWGRLLHHDGLLCSTHHISFGSSRTVWRSGYECDALIRTVAWAM